MEQIMRSNTRISATQAAVLCALEALEQADVAQKSMEELRRKLRLALEDSAKLNQDAELSRRECEQLRREISTLRGRAAN
jgi:hypothetical protein